MVLFQTNVTQRKPISLHPPRPPGLSGAASALPHPRSLGGEGHAEGHGPQRPRGAHRGGDRLAALPGVTWVAEQTVRFFWGKTEKVMEKKVSCYKEEMVEAQ